eukprot:g5892.t1
MQQIRVECLAVFFLFFFVIVGTFDIVFSSTTSEDIKGPFAPLDSYTWKLEDPQFVRTFKYRSYGEITGVIHDLERRFPDFVEVYSAQARYGVASPGMCSDLDNKSTPCKHWIVVLHDKNFNTNKSGKSGIELDGGESEIPDVFFSGALHGNERIGPNAMTEFIIFLLETLEHDGPGSWVGQMLRSRRVVVMPTTNSLGYFDNTRTEAGIDPNRDFPFMQNPNECMVTAVARAVNEVWRDNLFQLAITYHGGQHSISFEWGSTNHYVRGKSTESPDDKAQYALTKKMRSFAGSYDGLFYDVGRMNDNVYAVPGGMEDWGYGASWDTTAKRDPCTPSSFGGYPKEKTIYSESMIRSFNILVETWRYKQPRESELGDSRNILVPNNGDNEGDGHIARNLRLAFFMVDVAQPYISLEINGKGLSRKPVGSLDSTGFFHGTTSGSTDGGGFYGNITKKMKQNYAHYVDMNTESIKDATISWEVGGALEVDATHVIFGKLPSSDVDNEFRSLMYRDRRAWIEKLEKSGYLLHRTDNESGSTRWGKLTDEGNAFEDFVDTPFLPKFTSAFPHNLLPKNVPLFAIVEATVDSALASQSNPDPNLPPQSHWVNARTNESWEMENNGHKVKGHTVWLSFPVVFEIKENEEIGAETAKKETTTPSPSNSTNNVEPNSDTIDEDDFARNEEVYSLSPEKEKETDVSVARFAGALTAVIVSAILYILFRRRRKQFNIPHEIVHADEDDSVDEEVSISLSDFGNGGGSVTV